MPSWLASVAVRLEGLARCAGVAARCVSRTSVVVVVPAGVVGRLGNRRPDGAGDSSWCLRTGWSGEGALEAELASLGLSDLLAQTNCRAKVRVLADDDCHIEALLVRGLYEVDGECYVNALLLTPSVDPSCVGVNALILGVTELASPEVVPVRAGFDFRDSGVETRLDQIPIRPGRCDGVCNLQDVKARPAIHRRRVWRMGCPGGACKMKQILAVYENKGAHNGNTRPGAVRAVGPAGGDQMRQGYQ